MKKILYSLLTLAAALTVASCQKEPVNASDPNFGGKPVTMAFDVNLGMATKADTPTASAFDNGKTVDKLYVAAFDASSGALVSTSLVGDNATTITDGANRNVKLTLAKGGNYNVVFFAMKTGKYTVNFADNNVATFAYTTDATYKANDAENDAFYAKTTVTNAATNSDPISVELKRPFAQINVLSSNIPDGQTAFRSTMTVKKVPTSFNLFEGKVGTALSDMTFAENTIAATSSTSEGLVSPNSTYPYWIGMNYVLVPSAGKVDLSFQEKNGMAEALNLTGITVKANNRTNLVGAIYDLNADMTYNVTVGGLEGEGTGDIAGEDQTITVAGGSTYTTTNPLSINAAAAATQSVTLSFNGNSIADVEAGATTPGDKVTAASNKESVATAAVSGNDVVITPVGNGDAVITVSVPGYTKATYKPTTYDIPVHVEGVKKDVTITVTAPTDGKLAIETGKTGTITAAAKDADNNDVAIVYTTSDETVATVKDGTVTGVKAGTATITLSTAETETLNAAESKTVTVTVTDPETPSGPAGSGTAADPYNVAKALEEIAKLESGKTADAATFTKGKIVSITEISPVSETSTFGNATYLISDDGTATSTVTVFRGYYLANEKFTAEDQIKAGDEVIVYGKLQRYVKDEAETPEITNNYIYSLNGTAQKIQTSLSFSSENVELELGKTKTITASVTPSDAAVVYSSSNTAAVAVDPASGMIEVASGAVAGAKATITATVTETERYTGITASYQVTLVSANTDVTEKTDVLNLAFTGVSGTNYTAWEKKSGSKSDAVYAGQSAGDKESIQLRSNSNNSGIISTTSGGKVTKVVVSWHADTVDARELSVYGSTTAYTAVTDLYDTSKQGELLGTIKKENQTTLEITGDYTYIGLRSKSGAMYLTEIQITWED